MKNTHKKATKFRRFQGLNKNKGEISMNIKNKTKGFFKKVVEFFQKVAKVAAHYFKKSVAAVKATSKKAYAAHVKACKTASAKTVSVIDSVASSLKTAILSITAIAIEIIRGVAQGAAMAAMHTMRGHIAIIEYASTHLKKNPIVSMMAIILAVAVMPEHAVVTIFVAGTVLMFLQGISKVVDMWSDDSTVKAKATVIRAV